MSHTASTQADVPRLIEELRRHIVRKTGKPIDPDVDFITTQIETLSFTRPLDNEWIGLALTEKERRLLDLLASRRNMTFPKDAIANALYFDSVSDQPGTKIIDVFVHKIRCKLARADASIWIATTWGVGYRCVNESAREAFSGLLTPKAKKSRASRSVEWRPGVSLGCKQAQIAEYLHAKLGEWHRSRDIADANDLRVGSLTAQMGAIIRSIAASAYGIEHRHGFGYRMVLKPT